MTFKLTFKILQAHNRYIRPGGEDTVIREEKDLLQKHGHTVEQFFVANDEGIPTGGVGVALTGLKTVWSPSGYRAIAEALADVRPDLIHVHNTFPLLSPSIYWAAQKAGVPVVQTLHNYRLTCTNGLLMREGQPCEDCVGRLPLPALKHRCYRGSLAGTGSLAMMQVVNRSIGSYRNKVDAYIALTDFARDLMTRAGLPQEKVFVKPNFVLDGLPAGHSLPQRDKQIVFVGRIDWEKGADLLVKAWSKLCPQGCKLVIIGDGPQRQVLEQQSQSDSSIQWRGHMERDQVLAEVQRSQYLVLPSRWYEGQPMVLLEAMCAGTPTVVPRLGAMPEITGGGEAGLLFRGGDVGSLSETLAAALDLPDTEWMRKSESARRIYLERYTPEANYPLLMQIYQRVLEGKALKA